MELSFTFSLPLPSVYEGDLCADTCSLAVSTLACILLAICRPAIGQFYVVNFVIPFYNFYKS